MEKCIELVEELVKELEAGKYPKDLLEIATGLKDALEEELSEGDGSDEEDSSDEKEPDYENMPDEELEKHKDNEIAKEHGEEEPHPMLVIKIKAHKK